MDVIGVEYPNHVTPAVRFTESVVGDYVEYQGAKYVIADPSYVNTTVGTSMPDLIKSNVTIIRLD